MVSSIQRGRPPQGAVIPRGDAIITYTPARTFRAYCRDYMDNTLIQYGAIREDRDTMKHLEKVGII